MATKNSLWFHKAATTTPHTMLFISDYLLNKKKYTTDKDQALLLALMVAASFYFP
jgi:hypothetical protein